MLLCYCSAIFNICAVNKLRSTNLLCTYLASPFFHHLLFLSHLLPLLCFSITSCACPPFSESQAPWLFQSPIQLKLSLDLTTRAAPVGSYHLRRVLPCYCISELLMTGGRDDTMEWMAWCHISILWSKTCKICSNRLS